MVSKNFHRDAKTMYSIGHLVYEINWVGDSICPIRVRCISTDKKYSSGFQNMPVFTFRYTILLRSLWTSSLMKNDELLKNLIMFRIEIFATVIWSENLNGKRTLIFNHSAKLSKNLAYITFMFHGIKPCHSSVVIHKDNKPTNSVVSSHWGGSPHIRVN